MSAAVFVDLSSAAAVLTANAAATTKVTMTASNENIAVALS